MLDPLSCFGIACNVMQVISLSIEITSIVKRIKKEGTADTDLREHAGNLSKISNELENYLKGCDLKQLLKNQVELQEITVRCLETSRGIQALIDNIDSTRGGRVVKALKMRSKKSTFERLEKAMQKYQDTMQTHILVHLCNRNDAAALEQETRFHNLDKDLQTFIKSYVRGHAQLENRMLAEFGATQSLISAANEATIRHHEAGHHKTREYFAATHDTTEARRDHKAQIRQLLDSLDDKEMNARRNQIEKAHTATFSWVFDKEIQRPWDSFTDWLSSDGSLYWICGKASSGKSTLMKFLIADQRTSKYLDEWAPSCAIYSHFFWNSGKKIQRSILGLLRSLLYQTFEENQHFLDNVLQKWPKVSKIKNADDWSRDTLEEVLLHSLSLHEKGVCIFVDGLDEIDPKDGSFDLLSLANRISSPSENRRVKICVSSRPETSFKLGLEPYPTLRLQDLTQRDVEVYATDFLRNKCSLNLSGSKQKAFIDEIVTKANGVFLWVSLALKSLQRGSTNGDDPLTLMERLRALPSELGKLYEEMLKRLGDDQGLYLKEAALIFNIILFFPEDYGRGNLFQYAVAFDPTLRDRILKPKCLPLPRSLNKALLDVDRKLASRCAGILEVVNFAKDNTKTIEQILSGDETRPWSSIGIEFIHRSAKDFLLSMKHELLDQDTTSAADRKLQVLQAITLDDLYRDNERHHLHSTNECTAMGMILNTRPILSDMQELIVLKLIQQVYQRRGWSEFYELAARYSFHYLHAHLLESSSEDFKPRLNYLLVCALSDYNERTHTTAEHFLDMGANPNYVAFTTTHYGKLEFPFEDPAGTYLYLPTPLLGLSLKGMLQRVSGNAMGLIMEEMVHLFLTFGVDIERKFLSIEVNPVVRCTEWFRTDKGRPVYDVTCYGGARARVDLLVEINCIDIILTDFMKRRSSTHAPENLGIISRLGLHTEKAHRKVLLCFYEDTVYGVNDEDSDLLNEICDWARSEEDTVDNEEDGGSDNHNSGDDNDGSSSHHGWPSDKKAFEKAYNMLKGNEVYDVRKWLSDRGYLLPEESDLVGLPKASFDEVAEIYQRLNERFGLR